MNLPIEEPTVTHGDGKHEDYRTTHPAYGQISCCRVSGNMSLYDSDFKHQHHVRIRICTSEHVRNLSNDWHHERGQLMELAMSESQWAHFITSMNVGGGSPCTLTYIQGKGMIPQLPSPKPMTERFAKEIKASMEDNLSRLKDLEDKIAALDKPMGKKEMAELGKSINLIRGSLVGSTKFIADQFDEHVEGTVNKAKTEINAYVLNNVVKAGLQSIADAQEKPVLELVFEEKNEPL